MTNNALEDFFFDSFIQISSDTIQNGRNEYVYGTLLKGLKIKGKMLDMILPDRFSSDQYFNLCLAAVQQDGLALEWVEEPGMELGKYKSLCYEAVKQNGFSLYYVKQDLFKNEPRKLKILYNIAAYQNTDALQIIQDQNLKLCLMAVKKDAFALQWVNPTLFSKEVYGEICYTAFYEKFSVFLLDKMYKREFSETIRNYQALRFVDKNCLLFEKYRDICIEAIKYSEDALLFVDKSLWLDEEFCKEARKRWRSAEKYIRL
jgi:hypothetical protein